MSVISYTKVPTIVLKGQWNLKKMVLEKFGTVYNFCNAVIQKKK